MKKKKIRGHLVGRRKAGFLCTVGLITRIGGLHISFLLLLFFFFPSSTAVDFLGYITRTLRSSSTEPQYNNTVHSIPVYPIQQAPVSFQ
jgi:hypothetical protein